MKTPRQGTPSSHLRLISEVVAALSFCVVTASDLYSQPITRYSYFTDTETTNRGELLPFEWAADDIVSGTVRSNDSLSFISRSYRVNRVISARGISRGSCEFVNEPAEYEDPVAWTRHYSHLWNLARYYYYDYSKYLVRGQGNGLVQVFVRNFENEERIIESIRLDQSSRVLYFYGDVDVEGIFHGRLTIASEGDIGLVGDVRYEEADSLTGDYGFTYSFLGLVANDNIIIRNTPANGRGNGFGEEPANPGRHSIIINGSLIALNGSFTFDDQNDDGDEYEGPDPDERGTIYFKGSLAQRVRGYLHRDNHEGTGYNICARADSRLEFDGPPGFNSRDYPELEGNYDRLVLGGRDYTIHYLNVGILIVEPGTTLEMKEERASLVVYDSLILAGSERRPIRVKTNSRLAGVYVVGYTSINHTIFEEDLSLELYGDELTVRNSQFESSTTVSGTIRIDSCRFASSDELEIIGNAEINQSAFEDCGLKVSGRDSHVAINHCTIVPVNSCGIDIRERASASVNSSIIAFGRYGVKVDNRSTISIRYSNIAESVISNLIDCQPGEGCISADPLFLNARNGNFSLLPDSPCIDAGDPASPRDPDGTVADLGAFWLDRGLGNDDDGNPPYPPFNRRGGLPLEGLTASPNPFNATTVIRFEASPINREATVRIIDLQGRVVFSTNALLHSRTTALSWDATAYPAGIYIVRVGSGKEMKAMKLIKID